MKLRVLVALGILVPFASAQTVRVVDDDGGVGVFTTIQDAVDAAGPGDTVIVHPGSYAGFTIDGLSLVVHAATGTRPVVAGPVAIRNLSASQFAALRGLEINDVMGALPTPPVLGVSDCDGPVWVEDVVLNTPVSVPPAAISRTGARVANCESVVFVRCNLRGQLDAFIFGPINGLYVTEARVSVYDSTLEGGTFPQSTSLGNDSGDGVAGLFVDSGGDVFLSGCDVRGGRGENGIDTFFCNSCEGGDGGPGVELRNQFAGADPTVVVVDSTFTPGTAGPADDSSSGFCQTPCVDGVAGTQARILAGGLSSRAGVARSLTTISPIRDGETIVDTFTGDPGDFVVLAFSGFQSPGVQLPDVIGLGYLGDPGFFETMGVIDGTGELVFTLVNSGLLDPMFAGLTLYQQGIIVDSSLRIRISAPALLLLLNPPF